MRSEVMLLVMAVMTFYGYYAWSDALARGWVYYVSSGVLMAAIGWVFRRRCVSQAGIAACAITCVEGVQQAVCGAATFGLEPDGIDLCRHLVPDDLYRAIGSLACAGLLVIWWLPRPRP